MSRKRHRNGSASEIVELGLSARGPKPPEPVEVSKTALLGSLRNRLWLVAAIAFVLLLGLGVMAKNGWLPNTDGLTGKKTGWLGRELPTNASTTWNPLAAPPPPPPTPQLSKEYIYAGNVSRLLAVEDANANSAPPSGLAVWTPSN